MSIYTDVQGIGSKKHDERAAEWAGDALAAVDWFERAGALFNEPAPLPFYVTLGGVGREGRPQFSVRFSGQEVAQVEVANRPMLVVLPEHEEKNRRYFGLTTPEGRVAWAGKEAADFRRRFRLLRESGRPFRVRSPERMVESLMLAEMESGVGATKFDGTLRDIRHVGLTRYEYPFQVPLPISASKGKPKDSTGHMDIVARRGPRKLAIWELKAPGELEHVVQQLYVYGTVTGLMLRSSAGRAWWRLFGFGDASVPKKLTIECAAVVTEDQREGVVARRIAVRVKVGKNKVAPLFREAEFDLLFGSGIARISEVLELACDRGLVERSGGWFWIAGGRIAQGRGRACEWLREHPAAMDELPRGLEVSPSASGMV